MEKNKKEGEKERKKHKKVSNSERDDKKRKQVPPGYSAIEKERSKNKK